MAQPGIKELLEAGVHFGHQTRRWNPKMRRFLHGERDGIYIIDLLKTKRLLDQASEFAGTVAHRGGTVLFVGTKKQARDAVREVADATGMPYVNHRWLGGLLTNFQTMSERIRRLHDLERYETEGQLALLPTRERLSAQADLAKLRANLGGVKNMKGTPSAIFIIDLKTEVIAVREAQRLRIPIIGLVDTNCDPDGIDFVIPGNDDAIRSCAVITRAIGERVGEGADVYRTEQERLRAEAEERARREAEERAKREAEQAEQAAKAAAAAQEAETAAAAARAAAASAPSPADTPPVAAAAAPTPPVAPEQVQQAAPAATPEAESVPETGAPVVAERAAPEEERSAVSAEAAGPEPPVGVKEPGVPQAAQAPTAVGQGEHSPDAPPPAEGQKASPAEASVGEQPADASPAAPAEIAGQTPSPAEAPTGEPTAGAEGNNPADAPADGEGRPRRARRLGRSKAATKPAAAPGEEPGAPEAPTDPAGPPEGEQTPDAPPEAPTPPAQGRSKTAAAPTATAEVEAKAAVQAPSAPASDEGGTGG